ncbi:hypothetical protein NKI77_19020 [Mesorhizobium opportunistum]|uniref:PRTase-CE domain-containing protein n=1 Tax=Mesorhizobium opportunistum TaxID=593909 RepID=A0ABV1YHS5_9HYPH|nr:hypothetical protein [Mesorhizobium sp.]TIN96522.1 MAG: hypothetical protein E5Y06_09090 [Mesorhizobium sp.]TJU98197.1 MAG: hypothetical protein E5Y08_14920 [Mesorhizobium sp.]TJV15991.1 MAG: hypothetical protein E5Y07_20215 [Mesorhizobium sp.]
MPERDRLLQSIAATVADYRLGELASPSPQHVDQWIQQFPVLVQQPILTELEHVLAKTYFTKAKVLAFLSSLVTNAKLAGADPCSFWRGVKFLKIQGGGNSQSEMLQLFSEALYGHCGFTVDQCGENPTAYLYLDDVIFSGGRIRTDLTAWINQTAPATATVHVVTIGEHSLGTWYANKEIRSAATAANKTLQIKWWRAVEIENRRSHTDVSDVLRPTVIPNDAATQAYVENLGYPPVLRTPGSVGGRHFFSSEQGRSLLEQEFLKVGVYIRSICPNLGVYQRPLGNMVLKTTGFGSMIVTFRNCPNNAPLALWAGNPWYPLFRRKTN